jgi:uncharacterized protein YdeI (YjbR/CyaY-like superfamily)
VPDDVSVALEASPDAGRRFASLPVSHRTEYLAWIEQAKRSETRVRRIACMIERLQAPPGRSTKAGGGS